MSTFSALHNLGGRLGRFKITGLVIVAAAFALMVAPASHEAQAKAQADTWINLYNGTSQVVLFEIAWTKDGKGVALVSRVNPGVRLNNWQLFSSGMQLRATATTTTGYRTSRSVSFTTNGLTDTVQMRHFGGENYAIIAG
ncbi:hypothetical protein DFR72_117212 [Lentzea flaviverrucosa]|uniref:Uncharacterized protein n=1 Tax=Lentzea flaviverrucosa TaxID=200379 RepID=A0A1H9XRW4_9PSEU|nr:hypothetical protein DFR72_117212 [Lentzea flaviverrucosa]SES48890.1 hypothetical protein SAMN05216195_1177 [Lentzea flaviverrucosa]